MIEIISILIVEDDKSVISSYDNTIKTINLESGAEYSVVPDFKTNFSDAEEALSNGNSNYTAAIVDLKLRSGRTDLNEGNIVAKRIHDEKRIPVYFITGTPSEVDESIPRSIFWKIYSRDEIRFEDVFSEIIQIHKTGLTKILGQKGKLESVLSEIFWKNLPVSFNYWLSKDTLSVEERERRLLRFILSHLHEYLEYDETEENLLSSFDPAEFYILPPIKKNLFTCEILKEPEYDSFYMVLTPACDLVQAKDKIEDFLVAKIEPISSSMNSEKKKSAKSNKTANYHYLPPFIDIPGGFVNFRNLMTINLNDVAVGDEEKKYVRIASVNVHFSKDIISRFAYYYSRQGSPSVSNS